MRRLWLVAVTLALAFAGAGCLYKGAKVVDGTDLAVGIELPSTSGELQINALNYLSGFRLAVQDGDGLLFKHNTTEEWNYFSVVKGKKVSVTEGKVIPPNPTKCAVVAIVDYPHEVAAVLFEADYPAENGLQAACGCR